MGELIRHRIDMTVYLDLEPSTAQVIKEDPERGISALELAVKSQLKVIEVCILDIEAEEKPDGK